MRIDNPTIVYGLQNLDSSVLNQYSKVFVLTDLNTSSKCLPLLQSSLEFDFKEITVPDGEARKTLSTVEQILQRMIPADRKSLLVNLGGGVITDMGGLAAGLYKRGIDFVNIPTTILGMADASVGGKTGVNLDGYKNHVGCFSNPKMVILDTSFLNTLSYRQLLNGFAEMIKIGFIYDESLYQQLKLLKGPKNVDYSILKLAIDAKLKITDKVPFEQGERKLLNFGHTIGHGIESVAMDDSPDSLLHGEAVAIGMLAESFISMKMNLLNEENFFDLKDFVVKFYSDIISYVPNFERISRYLISDKKNTFSGINFSLPISIGKGKTDLYPPESLIRESLSFLQSL